MLEAEQSRSTSNPVLSPQLAEGDYQNRPQESRKIGIYLPLFMASQEVHKEDAQAADCSH